MMIGRGAHVYRSCDGLVHSLNINSSDRNGEHTWKRVPYALSRIMHRVSVRSYLLCLPGFPVALKLPLVLNPQLQLSMIVLSHWHLAAPFFASKVAHAPMHSADSITTISSNIAHMLIVLSCIFVLLLLLLLLIPICSYSNSSSWIQQRNTLVKVFFDGDLYEQHCQGYADDGGDGSEGSQQEERGGVASRRSSSDGVTISISSTATKRSSSSSANSSGLTSGSSWESSSDSGGSSSGSRGSSSSAGSSMGRGAGGRRHARALQQQSNSGGNGKMSSSSSSNGTGNSSRNSSSNGTTGSSSSSRHFKGRAPIIEGEAELFYVGDLAPVCFEPDWLVIVESPWVCKSDVLRLMQYTEAGVACGMDMGVRGPPVTAAAAAASPVAASPRNEGAAVVGTVKIGMGTPAAGVASGEGTTDGVTYGRDGGGEAKRPGGEIVTERATAAPTAAIGSGGGMAKGGQKQGAREGRKVGVGESRGGGGGEGQGGGEGGKSGRRLGAVAIGTAVPGAGAASIQILAAGLSHGTASEAAAARDDSRVSALVGTAVEPADGVVVEEEGDTLALQPRADSIDAGWQGAGIDSTLAEGAMGESADALPSASGGAVQGKAATRRSVEAAARGEGRSVLGAEKPQQIAAAAVVAAAAAASKRSGAQGSPSVAAAGAASELRSGSAAVGAVVQNATEVVFSAAESGRDVKGKRLLDGPPYSGHAPSAVRIKQGLPVQVRHVHSDYVETKCRVQTRV